MNTTRYLTGAAVAAMLICAAPAYSQVAGGHVLGGGGAGGALGGTLGGGLGGITGSGQAMGHGSLGGAFDTDGAGRISRGAEGMGGHIKQGAGEAVGRTRDVAGNTRSKVTNAAQGASAPSAPSSTISSSSSNAARGLDVGGALSGNGRASATRHERGQPASNSATAAATDQPSSERGLVTGADLNGNANASAKRDASQPAGHKVDASASADTSASATHR